MIATQLWEDPTLDIEGYTFWRDSDLPRLGSTRYSEERSKMESPGLLQLLAGMKQIFWGWSVPIVKSPGLRRLVGELDSRKIDLDWQQKIRPQDVEHPTGKSENYQND